MKQLETVGWLYTHVQSGDHELSTDEDYRDAAEIERDYWNRQEVVLKSAAIAAIESQGVPDGWQLVPKEPTDEMVRAALHLDLSYMPGHDGPDHAAVYKAMLASAPPAPQAKPQPLSDEQLKQLLAAEYNSGWADCKAAQDGPF